ncbi:class I SAM-dependent methyltransferase [Paenibacillus sinopodophylli]|uniref:class I SAM-dependent methyltransferase n=1 Tax=Paenibacillus sinopodophylli TaxID=1837342 RepID=UPI00110CCEA5|nr:class I SAM-dependent methyltransferase [Paenibacillus sinopodophylli]
MSEHVTTPFDYKAYWENNYAQGGTSGSGSYGVLADFKAEVINTFMKDNSIQSVIEFGCGDGNQLSLMHYKQYLGLDVASSSIDLCAQRFETDHTKSFLTYNPRHFMNKAFFTSDLVVCLDVLYHITDPYDFRKTLDDIFSCNAKYVLLYTRITGSDEPSIVPTIRDRDILQHLEAYQAYRIVQTIEQKHKELSSASFIILQKF